jgi:amidase/aspartyl-tRNA(Asn)/glutamyl-tRNA(Gln) amidotransferase subunit A
MRKSIREVSVSELEELAAQYNIEIDDERAQEIRDGVNDRLSVLDRLYEVPIREGTDLGERSWHEPESDPHNAITIDCRVEPEAETDGLLAGVSVGLKDIIAVAGIPMQCASGFMRGFVPGSDATVVRRLRAAGAEITAKTNLDEFASGGRAMSFDGRIQNPHDAEHVAGGSSGGSAAAVASDAVDLALGTDTGGSVRLPAAFCGVVGMKPTYGLVPLTGVVENTYSLDHVGPIAPTVGETAALLESIAGKEASDTASMVAAGHDDYREGGYVEAAEDPPAPSDLRVGVLEEGMSGATAGIEERTRAAIDRLSESGAMISSVSVDHFDVAPMVKNAITFHELATYWRDGSAPYRRSGVESVNPGDQVGFAHRISSSTGELDPFYIGRILAGARLIEAHDGRYYTRALRAKERIREEFEETLRDFDALVWPTAGDVAPKIDEADKSDNDFGRNTRIINLTWLPAVSVPNGTVDGLPVGLQFVGNQFGDAHLLGVASAFESIRTDE